MPYFEERHYTCILCVDPTPNALLHIVGCCTPIAPVRIAGCPTPIALVRISACPTPNGLTPYSRVSYSECPTLYSRVSYSKCPTLYKCAILRIDTIWCPTPYKNPTPVGAPWRSFLAFTELVNNFQKKSHMELRGIFRTRIRRKIT